MKREDLFVLGFLGFWTASAMAACSLTKPACIVIDAAHAACQVIRFQGADGKIHEVPVSREDLLELGKKIEARKP